MYIMKYILSHKPNDPHEAGGGSDSDNDNPTDGGHTSNPHIIHGG
jgi:hypothetical protein